MTLSNDVGLSLNEYCRDFISVGGTTLPFRVKISGIANMGPDPEMLKTIGRIKMTITTAIIAAVKKWRSFT